MKRVLLLIKGLGPGGAEQLLVSSAGYLDQSKYRYEIAYLLPNYNSSVPLLEAHGLPVHCLEASRGVGWIRRLTGLIDQHEIDLLHVHSPYAAIGARLVWNRRRLRFVYTEHNVWESYRLATYWGNLLTYHRNDHVFAVSDHVRSSIRKPKSLAFLPLPPCETVYHGLDPAEVRRWGSYDGVRAELGIPENAPLIGTVGNLRSEKGHRYLLEAAVEVRRVFPEARFLIVGHGPLESDLRRKAAELRLDGTVIFAGYREDAPRVMAALDIFVLPSLYEGLSIALIEALALGKPVVTTDAGGIPEVVDHDKHALIVGSRDPHALADALLTLLDDEEMRMRLGKAGITRSADFDIREAVGRVEAVYEQLLN